MRKTVLMLAMAVMTFSFVACGSKSSDSAKEETKQESTTRVVTDASNHEVTIPNNPERIVDLSGTSDILNVLGFNIVGTCNSDAYDYTKFPTYLEDALKDAKILGYSMSDTVDVESIITLNPDLIVISKVQEANYDKLAKIAPTIVVNPTQVDFRQDFRDIAKIMDKEEEGEKWLASYDEQAKEVSALMKEKLGEDSSYLCFLASNGSNFILADAALGSVLYDDLGVTRPEALPKQDNMELPVVSNEGLAEFDADYLFLVATDDDLAKLQKDAVYKNLKAVKEGNVIVLPASPYFNQGYSPIGRLAFIEELKTFVAQLSE